MLNVFISGLERQTGKTLVTAGIAATMQSLAFTTCVYKPIQTGAIILNGVKSSPDLSLFKRIDPNLTVDATYILSGKESPFVSSYEDKLKIDIQTICDNYKKLAQTMDCSIVEGVNSISTPIAENMTELDLIKTLGLPLVLVINPKKTQIDTVISGLKYIKSERIEMAGVILNQHDKESDNLEVKYFPQIINEFSDIKVLGSLPDYGDMSNVTAETIISNILNNINIEEMFGLKIAKLSQD